MSHIITYLDIDVEFDDDGEILFMYDNNEGKHYFEHKLSDNDRAEIRRLIDRHLDQVFADADRKELNKMNAAYWGSKL